MKQLVALDSMLFMAFLLTMLAIDPTRTVGSYLMSGALMLLFVVLSPPAARMLTPGTTGKILFFGPFIFYHFIVGFIDAKLREKLS